VNKVKDMVVDGYMVVRPSFYKQKKMDLF